ncbi:MAG: hypothetical protein DMF78_10010 [Acidobacteria bacterium]|nr:MAG: hypothetical protein DMF78_10010 [Acidobacteriota bacterium]
MKHHRAAVLTALLVSIAVATARASSHREAPLISQDPTADNTDVYAFVSPADPGKVTLISNFIPLEAPSGGPNFFKFDDNVLYEIHVDNNGDAVEDITFQFRFTTEVRNGSTFLYNVGPVTSLDSPNLIVVQRYTLTRVKGGRGSANRETLATGLLTAPNNVGINSMPSYPSLAAQAVQSLAGGIKVFAGQREDGFYVDLSRVFDLLQVTRGTPRDGVAGFNVHTIAVEVPIEQLTRSGTRPTSLTDPAAVIGVWSTASRPAVSVLRPGGRESRGEFVQVSRLGNPLVNEVVIPRGMKDAFNASEPKDDAQFAQFVTDPEVGRLLTALFGLRVPPPPRNDLVQVFLTGIPGLTQPPGVKAAEELRLNVAVPPNRGTPNRLGVLGGDLAGYPNGRRVGVDVVDIALTAVSGILVPGFGVMLGDGVDGNDAPYLDAFPYLGTPHPGNQ